jgi:TM2 domain-containing membrane protein YozV
MQPSNNDTFTIQRMGNEEGPFTFSDLQMQVRSGTLKSDSMVKKPGGNWFQAKDMPGLFSEKQWMTTLLLSILVGGLGADRFYLGQTGLGIAKLLTCGGVGIWSLIDIILVATGKMTDKNGLPLAR